MNFEKKSTYINKGQANDYIIYGNGGSTFQQSTCPASGVRQRPKFKHKVLGAIDVILYFLFYF